MNRCVVVQGPTNFTNVLNIKKHWKNIPIVYSTWEGSDTSCYSTSDIVVLNKIPTNRGVQNLNLQKISSLNGILKAKELGFTRVIKWREDMYPTNSSEFLKLLKLESINFLAFMNHLHGYFTDYFIEGDVDILVDIFENIDINVPYPEYAITKRILENDITDINFVGNSLTIDNDIIWTKRQKKLSSETNGRLYLNSILPNVKNNYKL